jgi:nitroreductase
MGKGDRNEVTTSFYDLARTRRSVRRYSDRPVDRETIDRCIDAARIAPSASNTQPWRFVVVTDPSTCRQIGAATVLPPSAMNRFVATAPVIIAQFTDRPSTAVSAARMVKRLDYPLIDAGIAASQLCLQAAESGLGTCMIGWFNAKKIKRLLYAPRGARLALLITLGYPEEPLHPEEKHRRPLDAIRSFERFRR